MKIFGDDYPTRDGFCIRDYIHIADLAQAHLLAVERLLNRRPGDNFNLGTGEGYSVKEVVDFARKITGKKIPLKIVDKRPGDPLNFNQLKPEGNEYSWMETQIF